MIRIISRGGCSGSGGAGDPQLPALLGSIGCINDAPRIREIHRSRLWTRNRRKAAEGQRATSTDQPERGFLRVVARAEPCGDGLRAFGMADDEENSPNEYSA